MSELPGRGTVGGESPNGTLLTELAAQRISQQLEAGASLDTRLVAVAGFDVAGAAAVLANMTKVGFLGFVAILGFAIAVVICLRGVRPRTWETGPRLRDEAKIRESLSASSLAVHIGLLDSLGDAYSYNARLIRRKAEALIRAMWLTGAAAVIAGALYSVPTVSGGSPIPDPIPDPGPSS